MNNGTIFYLKIKRILDIIISLILIIILSLPMLIISIIIKLCDKEKVIYRSERIGKDEKNL